ncbi:glutamate transport system substrate-binding protein [Amycolatopsis xylanica]|uniref:Glutamate transport system substrate-binding protein n=1 Tax=Amycolatopsis xylanica TaxID=589385 RepID=A0A1H2SIA7_9PSEU|nr:glutamate ABC transporter substrate-binding protein [Amycolatopsis xylanica]SDW31386.1 glutamate transport system substrate-binding protein [Amycolatopsis xylanica]
MRLRRSWCALLVVATTVTGCGSEPPPPGDLLASASAGKLTIGIRFDQPGMGLRTLNKTYEGFDIDVARYVAAELGVDPEDITWQETRPANREKFIAGRAVDFVVGAYTIDDERKRQVGFAGPYLTVGQDLLVRRNDNSITGPQSLNGKRLCTVSESTSAQYVKDTFAHETKLVEYKQYSDCVASLLANLVDAITTGNALLSGYAGQHPELLKVVNKPFTQRFYGIGLRKDDNAGRAKINDALRKMISTGAWRASLQANLGPSGYTIPPPPTISD